MTRRKSTHPCRVCGRRLKTHRRAKAPACSKLCRDQLSDHLKTLRRLARNPHAMVRQ